MRVAAPNDPKLSDRGARRGTCAVGGKAAVEAGAVTCGAVRCSAWLGVSSGVIADGFDCFGQRGAIGWLGEDAIDGKRAIGSEIMGAEL